MFLYSAVSSPLACSKRFTLHSLADLFIPIPTRLISITAMYSFKELNELWRREEIKNVQSLKQQ